LYPLYPLYPLKNSNSTIGPIEMFPMERVYKKSDIVFDESLEQKTISMCCLYNACGMCSVPCYHDCHRPKTEQDLKAENE
jgi:hypothetical protein